MIASQVWTRVVAVVVASGCHAAFDLDETEVRPEARDLDGDGIIDDVDNCPGISNVDQLDTDDDAIGDACDACPRSAEVHGDADEDADGVVDACDVCPGTPDRSQIDRDGDGVGDPCDLLATPQRRVLFDSFSPASTAWDVVWPGDGALTPSSFPARMKLGGLQLHGEASGEWHAETQIRLDRSPVAGEFGFSVINPITSTSFECGVSVQPASTAPYTGYVRIANQAVDRGNFAFAAESTRLRISLHVDGGGTAGITCAWDVVAYSFVPSDQAFAADAKDIEVSLVAERPHTITYVDIVD